MNSTILIHFINIVEHQRFCSRQLCSSFFLSFSKEEPKEAKERMIIFFLIFDLFLFFVSVRLCLLFFFLSSLLLFFVEFLLGLLFWHWKRMDTEVNEGIKYVK